MAMRCIFIIFLVNLVLTVAFCPDGVPKCKKRAQDLPAGKCCVGRHVYDSGEQFKTKVAKTKCYDGYCLDGGINWSDVYNCNKYKGGCFHNNVYYSAGQEITTCEDNGVCLRGYCKSRNKIRAKIVDCDKTE